MADWIIEGTAARSPGRAFPVRHLLVDDCHGGWALWCSASAGIKDNNPHSRKFCRECRTLAQEAIDEGTLSRDDVHAWDVKDAVAQ